MQLGLELLDRCAAIFQRHRQALQHSACPVAVVDVAQNRLLILEGVLAGRLDLIRAAAWIEAIKVRVAADFVAAFEHASQGQRLRFLIKTPD